MNMVEVSYHINQFINKFIKSIVNLPPLYNFRKIQNPFNQSIHLE